MASPCLSAYENAGQAISVVDDSFAIFSIAVIFDLSAFAPVSLVETSARLSRLEKRVFETKKLHAKNSAVTIRPGALAMLGVGREEPDNFITRGWNAELVLRGPVFEHAKYGSRASGTGFRDSPDSTAQKIQEMRYRRRRGCG
jgi:hypothetical protein